MKESPALRAVMSRRSVRRFLRKPVPDSALEIVLKAGMRAPSPHNTQPWLFVAIKSEEERDELAAALGKAYLAFLSAAGDREAKEKARKAFERTREAPALVVLCLDRAQLKPQATASRRKGEWMMGSQGVAAAAENMLIAACAVGLGGCWRGAPVFSAPAVRRCLGLPGRMEPQVMLELGYPAQAPGRKELKAKDEVVRYGIRRS
ncbi:MAG TPA: nitroreductase family protein [Conexivisphaerales archaeon]|nr:nitroreductase family protein [Conexivisphaerales archaeon]